MKIKTNVYNIFKVRKTDFPPDHFEYTRIDVAYNLRDALERWIETKLKSKYYIGKDVVLDEKNNIVYKLKIGFSDPKELSYFMLACPYLKYK